MISFKLLDKEDLTTLFEGFDTSFLQIPIKHHTKELQRYIPKGFRPDKLQRFQLIKIYTDAIVANEFCLSDYVTKEIERVFGVAGITEYIIELGNEPEHTETAMLGVTVRIMNNEICVPPHIVLKLYGIKCNDAEVKISNGLYEAIENQKTRNYGKGFIDGKDKTEKNNSSELEEGRKKLIKLQKELSNETEKSGKLAEEIKKLNQESQNLKKAAEANSRRTEELEQCRKDFEKCKKEKTLLEEKVHDALLEIAGLKEKLETDMVAFVNLQKLYDEQCEERNGVISEEAMKSIAHEVVSAIRSKTIGQAEILAIAKKRFEENSTILAGWEMLSSDSSEVLERLLDDVFGGRTSFSNLEHLDSIENNVLVEYAIISTLRANVLKILSSQEYESRIQSQFETNE